MQRKQNDYRRRPALAALLATMFLGLVAASRAEAATVTVLVDTPTAFRATFTGLDPDASSVGINDFFGCTVVPCQFKYWSLLMNLRGDSVTGGNANGFYEIVLIHSGTALPDPTAPVVHTFLFYTGAEPGIALSDDQSSSAPHAGGTDMLSTTNDITFDGINSVAFAGTIAGDSDLNADGIPDKDKPGATDDISHILNGIKKDGGITGQQKGDVMSDIKPGQAKKQ